MGLRMPQATLRLGMACRNLTSIGYGGQEGYGALFSGPGNPVRKQAVHCGSHPCRAQATAALETEAMAAGVSTPKFYLQYSSRAMGLWKGRTN
jgi:hypothetical protein